MAPRRGRRKTVCARGASRTLLGGRSTSPLDITRRFGGVDAPALGWDLRGPPRLPVGRGCGKTVCTRGSDRALLRGPSTSPLDGRTSRGTTRHPRERHPLRLRISPWVLCRGYEQSYLYTPKRLLLRGAVHGSRHIFRLRRDEAWRSVLGQSLGLVALVVAMTKCLRSLPSNHRWNGP